MTSGRAITTGEISNWDDENDDDDERYDSIRPPRASEGLANLLSQPQKDHPQLWEEVHAKVASVE